MQVNSKMLVQVVIVALGILILTIVMEELVLNTKENAAALAFQ